MQWLQRLISRRRRYDDLAVSIQEHLEERTEELMDDGMPCEEAARTARREFGSVTQITERSREAWQWPKLESIWADIRFALRQLRKAPGFTVSATLILTLGIGINTAVFSVVHHVLLEPLPFPQPGQLYAVWARSDAQSSPRIAASGPDFLDYQQQSQSFSSIAELIPQFSETWTGDGDPKLLYCTGISANFFSMLGVRPYMGRFYTARDYAQLASGTILISYRFWKTKLGGDPHVLGRVIHVGGSAGTIVGVTPPLMSDLFRETDVWATLTTHPSWPFMQWRSNKFLTVLGRLKPGITPAMAQEELTGILRRAPGEPPGRARTTHALEGRHGGKRAHPVAHAHAGGGSGALRGLPQYRRAFAGPVGATLCGDRSAAEPRRRAPAAAATVDGRRICPGGLGLPSRCAARVAHTSSAALARGIASSPAGRHSLERGRAAGDRRGRHRNHAVLRLGALLDARLSRSQQRRLPARRQLGALLDARLSRSHRVPTRRPDGRGKIASARILRSGRHRARLLHGPRSLRRPASAQLLAHLDLGFEPDRMLTTYLRTNYYAPEGRSFWRDVLDGVAAIPGVRAAAVADCMPGADAAIATLVFPDRPNDPNHAAPAQGCWASSDFFRVSGTPLLRGRLFNSSDNADSSPVIILNELAARRYWPGEDPIGKRIAVNYTGPGRVGNSTPRMREIVGIVQGMKQGAPEQPIAPAVYMPYLQDETNHDLASMSLFVRSEAAGLELESSMRAKIHALRPDQPVNEILSMQDLISQTLAPRRYTLSLLGTFAALSLLLSAVGIYGVISYITLERRREFGIRLALGATRSNVMAVVLRHGLVLTLTGVSTGLVAALLIARALTQLLFQISPLDAISFLSSIVLLGSISAAACLIPALRAAHLDPVRALQSE